MGVMQKRASMFGSYTLLSPGSLALLKPLFTKAQFADDSGKVATSITKRIMVVDDDKDIAMVLKLGLTRGGFVVDVFNDPLQALEHFKTNYYDLFLLDVKMPIMDGFQLCTALRQKDGNAKVCFISAFEIHEDELSKYFSSARPCFVKKPVLISELVKRLNDALSKDN